MPPRIKQWRLLPPLDNDAQRELSVFPWPQNQLLYNRGIRTRPEAERYLSAEPPPGTEPAAMLGIQPAVDRLFWAIRHQELIAIYGDYDVDGVTATALLNQALLQLGANVTAYIPNRFDEGYGLNIEALDGLYQQGVHLVVTVDCGIRSLEEADFAHHRNLGLIITDHHHPGSEIPVAEAVINPKQNTDTYPDKDLAGVGLAYKLAFALLTSEQAPGGFDPEVFLDLVALGTVADMAPLTGENRTLVRKGLGKIHQAQRQGLLSLIGAAGLTPQRITSNDIAYALAPRLNAAGRLDTAQAALNLLMSSDVSETARLAQQIDDQNRERQQITRTIQENAARAAMADDPNALLLFAVDENFNSGVVGLAASRLVEQYYRPAIVAQRGEQFTRGSCRSIPEFHITRALDRCADLLERHGGHAAAAGFTVRNEDVPILKERLLQIAAEEIGSLPLTPVLKADLEIPLSELKPELLKYLAQLQPTGQQNPAASFVSRNLKVIRSRTVGKDSAHLKLTVTDGKITYDAIAFRQGHWSNQLSDPIDILYAFEINEFNGKQELQLNITDIRTSNTPDE